MSDIYQIDDRHEIYNPYVSSCANCKHLNRIDLSCKAFEDIPYEILSGENKHLVPLPNQGNTIVFEPAI